MMGDVVIIVMKDLYVCRRGRTIARNIKAHVCPLLPDGVKLIAFIICKRPYVNIPDLVQIINLPKLDIFMFVCRKRTAVNVKIIMTISGSRDDIIPVREDAVIADGHGVPWTSGIPVEQLLLGA